VNIPKKIDRRPPKEFSLPVPVRGLVVGRDFGHASLQLPKIDATKVWIHLAIVQK
jgi:hypothetical protein